MVLVQLSEFTERNQQSRFLELADHFICKDNDVETFLKTKALDNEARHRSRTYRLLTTMPSTFSLTSRWLLRRCHSAAMFRAMLEKGWTAFQRIPHLSHQY